MAKCADLHRRLSAAHSFFRRRGAKTGTWKGATVFLTEKPADSETANSTPRAFTVTSESANAKSIELSDGQRNSPEFAKDDLGKRFVLLDAPPPISEPNSLQIR